MIVLELFMLLFQSCGCGNFREPDPWLSHVIFQVKFSRLPSHAVLQYYVLTVAARSPLDSTQPTYRAGIPDVGETILIAVHTCGSFPIPWKYISVYEYSLTFWIFYSFLFPSTS